MKPTRNMFFFLFLFFFLFGSIPVLEAQLTSYGFSSSVRQEDQQKIIESKLYLTRTQKTEIIRHPRDLKYMVERLTQNVKRALENLRFRRGGSRAVREQAKMRMDAVREQTRILKQRQETLYANQQDHLRNLKDRMETLARQRKDFMEFQRRR